jgi:CheY-like chemotaxis protein
MSRLIDDLLDVSRLSRGKVLLRKQPVDLTELVRAAAEDHRALLEAGGLRLRLSLPARPLWTAGDPTRLAQVIGNVLHNASKFTDPGGLVTVELADAGEGMAGVRVRDTGIGIEPAMLRRAFEAFSQADRSLARSRGGLGVGLALVKGLVELHGGKAHVASPGPGQGTEVTIRLPLAETPAGPVPAAAPAQRHASALRVLLIEDNADAAESMRLLLTLHGHKVRVEATGAAGLDAGRAFRPDVVLCDIGLPGELDGYEVARACRRDPVLAPACLIAATGYGRPEDQRKALDAGFDAHLTKPVDISELLGLLAAVPAQEKVNRGQGSGVSD